MPRVLSLDENGQLLINPSEEFTSLRRGRHSCAPATFAGQEKILDGITGDVMEIAVDVSVSSSGIFGLKVRMAHDVIEETVISLDIRGKNLSIDTSRSTLNPDVFQKFPIVAGKENCRDVRIQEAPFELKPGELLRACAWFWINQSWRCTRTAASV